MSDQQPDVLEEEQKQRFIGTRDLTHWPSAAGRLAVRIWQTASHWLAPHQVLALILVAGLALVGTLTAVAAEVYEAVVESDGIAGFDQPALDAAIAIRSGLLNDIVAAYTHLGDTPILPIMATVVAIGLSLWWRQWSPIILIAVTGFGALALTVVGKAQIARARPPIEDAVPPFLSSFSFPSGHSLNSMALAGIVTYLLIRWERRRWARMLTIGLALTYAITMGLSRVYLGAHWFTDVLVAWVVALAWLAVVITAHRLLLTAIRSGRSNRSEHGS